MTQNADGGVGATKASTVPRDQVANDNWSPRHVWPSMVGCRIGLREAKEVNSSGRCQCRWAGAGCDPDPPAAPLIPGLGGPGAGRRVSALVRSQRRGGAGRGDHHGAAGGGGFR